MKVIIVGGVAGGASCAARLRRLDETAEILMVERGPYVSYANCGLPYHVSGVIPKESSLMVANEELFRSQFAIDVRTSCEAISISPKKKTVDLRDVKTGKVTTEPYDKLVLSPSAPSVRIHLQSTGPMGLVALGQHSPRQFVTCYRKVGFRLNRTPHVPVTWSRADQDSIRSELELACIRSPQRLRIERCRSVCTRKIEGPSDHTAISCNWVCERLGYEHHPAHRRRDLCGPHPAQRTQRPLGNNRR